MRGSVNIILPDTYPIRTSKFANRRINRRSPYAMQGELIVAPSTSGKSFDPSMFLNNQEFPFEVLTMVPRVVCLDTNGIPIADPTGIPSVYSYVSMTMKLLGVAREMTKSNSRLLGLLPLDAMEMDFASPLYIERSEGFDVTMSNALPSSAAAGGVRISISFLGSLIELSER